MKYFEALENVIRSIDPTIGLYATLIFGIGYTIAVATVGNELGKK